MRGKLLHELQLLVRVRVWGWVRVMVEFRTSSTFRGWVRVMVLGYGFGVRGRKVKSRDCALASDLVRARSIRLNFCISVLEGPTDYSDIPISAKSTFIYKL